MDSARFQKVVYRRPEKTRQRERLVEVPAQLCFAADASNKQKVSGLALLALQGTTPASLSERTRLRGTPGLCTNSRRDVGFVDDFLTKAQA